ncbi:UNVERIFIED_CONTAM: Cyclin-A1-1 [Sesamum radiatum]|uniref:Cyclin-A1-1 n=1 Tax=Sesamum radiatum TaxID=300843 RepID=A0AAW2M6Z5_SESRA
MASASGARRSTTSSLAKRHASASENLGKVASSAPTGKKRPALANITNQRHGSGPLNSGRASVPEASKIVPCSAKIVSIKKGSSTSMNAGFSGATLPPTSSVKQSMVVPSRATSHTKSDVVFSKTTAASVSFSVDKSPDKSDALSVSMDESMSTCDSLKSPEVEYMDNNEIAAVDSIERKASNMLCISEHMEISGNICKRDVLAAIESDDKIVDVDDNLDDPQLCATIACDIYKHLRASEVAEEYRLVPDTLYLTVNYIDRYLSGNVMDRQRLQLLGVACMMIASKYEEICAPQVEEFCYITDNTYFKDEVLQMESAVLNYLKFEMTAPTPKCFLRRFVRAAQGVNEATLLQLECMANYVAELSLLEYNKSSHNKNLILLMQNSTLQHYTLYQSYDLRDCVLALHGLCCNSQNSSLPAVREKYSQHKVSTFLLSTSISLHVHEIEFLLLDATQYMCLQTDTSCFTNQYKFVAKKYCPPSVPPEYFHNESS